MAPNIGTLQQVDRQAIFDSAQRLGVHPYELGAVINQESGFRPNVHGGANKKYYGLIQFGPDEQKQYLDPNQINSYSIANQMPAVENFLTGRGYKPGMGIAKLYATILGGNPNASLTSKDAFGTSVSSSLSGFSPGGASYKQAQAVLGGDLQSNATPQSIQPFGTGPQTPPPLSPPPVPTAFLNTFINALNAKPEKEDDGFGGLTQPFATGVTAPMLVSVPGMQQMMAVTPQTLTPEYQAFASKFIAGR